MGALDDAYAGRLATLFNILCAAIAQGDEEGGLERFTRGAQIAKHALSKAKSIVDNLPEGAPKMGLQYRTLPNGRKIITGGRLPPREEFKGVRFSELVNVEALPAPPAWNWNAANPANAPDGFGNMLGNDTHGDCVWRAIAVITDSERAASGNPGWGTGNPNYGPITTDQVLDAYSTFTGFNKTTGANDNGTVIAGQGGALDAWQNQGVYGTKIVGYAALDPTNPEEVKTALWLFGNGVGGLFLPDSYMQNLKEWDLAEPNPNSGHCVGSPEGGYNSKGIIVNSWGYNILMTWAAVAKLFGAACGGEFFVVFTPDGINKASGRAPSGFNMAELTAKLAVLKAA